MAFGIFIHRADSIYRDVPEEQYQFPAMYLSRAEPCVGDWIIYYEPVKVRNSRGYFAVAKVQQIIPDPSAQGMFLALIEPDTYLDFAHSVPFSTSAGLIELGLLNDEGDISGRAQAAVRLLSASDFARIINAGLPESDLVLPRVDEQPHEKLLQDVHLQAPYEVERTIIQSLVNRPFRDKAFRQAVLDAYECRCAVTGWKLINGGGRAEVEAAHIRPVEERGPDSIQNGLALSGTAHWMFDRGLISLSDDLEILISRQVNDRPSVEAIINQTARAIVPERIALRPHPAFLGWHREHCFKH